MVSMRTALVAMTAGIGWASAASADLGDVASADQPMPANGFQLPLAPAKTRRTALNGLGLFADSIGTASFGRAQFLGSGLGGTALTLETSRPRNRVWGSLGWRSGAKLRLLASHPFATGALVLGIGAGIDRRRAFRGFSAGADRTLSSSRTIEFGWVSEERWRLTFGWQTTTGGGAHRSGSRLIDLASGAALHEHGPRMTLAFADHGGKVAYGMIASSATLASRDALAVGRMHDASDNRASLFWLTRF